MARCDLCGREENTEGGLCPECARIFRITDEDRELEREKVDELLRIIEEELNGD